ncbi:hypothetical protein LV89_02510 [Arcicella aurantiaca]|uniref:DUF3137 domain-containing protein n=1 Tax=Arcicella aurantiaca TaxID=591202 RepID=A0A316EAG9_9BACT|nr:hypothetical protein [Arcicella aurantiaca]PWK26339.1 hypothetical protein LV89_02510 [Arcicella aurantiaca]
MSFFTDLFYSRAKENWKLLAHEIQGKFVDGGFWETNEVKFNYRNTEITLDIFSKGNGRSSKTYTRIICPYITTNRFTFEISSENAISYAAKYIGINDIEIGNTKFDAEIYLQSNQKKRLLTFLDTKYLQEKFLEAFEGTDLVLKINDDHPVFFLKKIPTKILWIQIENIGIEEDIEILKSWFTLCKLTLDRLIEIGEAEDIDPNIQ